MHFSRGSFWRIIPSLIDASAVASSFEMVGVDLLIAASGSDSSFRLTFYKINGLPVIPLDANRNIELTVLI